ncbi:hypothetical protein LTR10_006099 [Elasticomyces elasticus]|nr:hypothetical protein LTR10_006099 [Elasticomyces elasticus]KAK4966848.1 hypothetical protein LTR42_011161 [Elasticomyces elasticus]
MAAQAVLAVSELLEMILLQLPMKDMQRSRAICKHWRAEVDSSMRIKRALFLEPGTPNDLAHDHQVHSFDLHSHIDRGTNGDYYALHPFITKVSRINDLVRKTEHHLQRVLLSQPPTMTGLIRLQVYGSGDGRGKTVTLEAGETFGSLHAKLEASPGLQELRRNDASVGLRWAAE